MSAKPSRKRKALTLQEWVNVIERSSRGEMAISIARSLEVGKTNSDDHPRQRLFLHAFSFILLSLFLSVMFQIKCLLSNMSVQYSL